jgi:SAM-dependent methyltransferase
MGSLKRAIRGVLGQTTPGYRLLLKHDYGVSRPRGYPKRRRPNAVLRSGLEVDEAVAEIRRLGLPVSDDRPKNWDSLAALDAVLKESDRSAAIFDAGGEIYSMILPWLFLYGYRNLVAGNLTFNQTQRRGPITYRHADITRTEFAPEAFDAVTCLSVIEHGVDLESYFREMGRIIKPGGVLVTSTDYYETGIDTRGQTAFGVPIHVFSRDEILAALQLARRHGLDLESPLDLHSPEKVVRWADYDLRYTFLVFSLRKAARTI